MREGAGAGSKMWKSEIRYFFKHFRQLQDSSTPEASSTNTRIKTSKINKSFAGAPTTPTFATHTQYTNKPDLLSSSGGPRPQILLQ